MIMMPITSPADSRLNPGSVGKTIWSSGVTNRERRELGEIDRDDGAEGNRDEQRDTRAHQRSREQRQYPVVSVGEKRRPLGIGEKLPERNMREERKGLTQQDDDDAYGGEN